MKRYYIFLAIVAIISGLAITGDYLMRRGPVYDNQAVSDIRAIASAVDSYYLSQNHLPSQLQQLGSLAADTKQRLARYEYRRVSTNSYQLCATFKTKHVTPGGIIDPATPIPASTTRTPGAAVMPNKILSPVPPNPDNHDKGFQCFTYYEISIMPYPTAQPLYKAQ